MGRTSRCPGCKIPKSEHTFGRASKDCQGAPRPDETDEVLSATGLASGSSALDSIQETLASLAGAVQSLTTDVQSLKRDNQALRDKVEDAKDSQLSPSSAALHPPGVPSRITSPELRDMKDLVSQVDSRVSQLGMLPESSDESDEENDAYRAELNASPATGEKPQRAGKLKSGKEARVTCTVRYPQLWPHSHLTFLHHKRETRYEDLKLEEFVASYGEILQSPDITDQEKTARLRHLVSLMYFAQQYEWHAMLSFHGAVLLEIERGTLKWGDSFLHLESRTLYSHLKSSTSTRPNKSAMPILFCRDYQRQQCSQSQDHYGYIRGERKWLRHICAECWTKNRQQELHREGSTDCPLSPDRSVPSKN